MISRAIALEAMRQWVAAVTEAQRQHRAYSWHQCFALRHEAPERGMVKLRVTNRSPS